MTPAMLPVSSTLASVDHERLVRIVPKPMLLCTKLGPAAAFEIPLSRRHDSTSGHTLRQFCSTAALPKKKTVGRRVGLAIAVASVVSVRHLSTPTSTVMRSQDP